MDSSSPAPDLGSAVPFYPSLAMATVCLGGGLIGMVQKGSARSLIAGALLGGAFAWSSRCIQQDQPLRGIRFATATSMLLTIAMGSRFYRTGAVLPSGMLMLAGAASTAYHGHAWKELS